MQAAAAFVFAPVYWPVWHATDYASLLSLVVTQHVHHPLFEGDAGAEEGG